MPSLIKLSPRNMTNGRSLEEALRDLDRMREAERRILAECRSCAPRTRSRRRPRRGSPRAVSPTTMPMSVIPAFSDRLDREEEDRLVRDRHELLRARVRDRSKTRSFSSGEDQRFHGRISRFMGSLGSTAWRRGRASSASDLARCLHFDRLSARRRSTAASRVMRSASSSPTMPAAIRRPSRRQNGRVLRLCASEARRCAAPDSEKLHPEASRLLAEKTGQARCVDLDECAGIDPRADRRRDPPAARDCAPDGRESRAAPLAERRDGDGRRSRAGHAAKSRTARSDSPLRCRPRSPRTPPDLRRRRSSPPRDAPRAEDSRERAPRTAPRTRGARAPATCRTATRPSETSQRPRANHRRARRGPSPWTR